jgi:hypothetical protein
MKKSLFILVILFLTLTSVRGQTNVYHPFPDSNSIWHQTFAGDYNTIDTSSYSYGLIGDTIINSRKYSKVYLLNDTSLNVSGNYLGCLREDSNKKVYYLGKEFWGMQEFTSEIQLYDFGKNVGDSIEYGIWGKKPVLSIDSILIGQNYRKRFQVLWDYFIEGIGSTIQLLSPITDIPTKYYTHWDLVCFKQDDAVLYTNSTYNGCFQTFGIKDNLGIQKTSLLISPNPFSQSAQITLYQTYHNIALAVYDIQGKQVAQQQYTDCDKIQFSRNQLSNGLYFLKLTLDDKGVETGKVVISEE